MKTLKLTAIVIAGSIVFGAIDGLILGPHGTPVAPGPAISEADAWNAKTEAIARERESDERLTNSIAARQIVDSIQRCSRPVSELNMSEISKCAEWEQWKNQQ